MIYYRKEEDVFYHMVMTKTKTKTKVLKRPIKCYIFEKDMTQGYQI